MMCKCGDIITEWDIEAIKRLPLKKVGVLDYPRCRGCLKFLASSVYRLVDRGRVYLGDDRKREAYTRRLLSRQSRDSAPEAVKEREHGASEID